MVYKLWVKIISYKTVKWNKVIYALYKYYKDSVVSKFTVLNNNDNLAHFEDTDIGLCANIDHLKNKVSSFGCVIYGPVDMYDKENIDNNLNIHLQSDRAAVLLVIRDYFQKNYNLKVKQITMGHEHGSVSKKCHFQVIVDLEEGTYTKIKPASFHNWEDENMRHLFKEPLLFMAQKARNNYALRNYCKKDGDFSYLYPEKAIKKVYKLDKKGEKTDKVDAWATVAQNKDLMTKDEAFDLVLTHEPRTTITMCKNIEYAFEKLTKPHLPDPVWSYPEHLKGKYPIIESWFDRWCKPDNLTRRKALLLFSKKRCLGKTRFAMGLINHEDYVVIFRNTFTLDALKDKTPKLLILDDMGCYNQNNRETWKGLVAGQQTAIRDAYANFLWRFEVPCIITTNNYALLKNLYLSEEFNTQIDFVEISDYMGPPGTQPPEMSTINSFFSSELKEQLLQSTKEREEFIDGKKIQCDFTGKKREYADGVLNLLTEVSQLKQKLFDIKKSK